MKAFFGGHLWLMNKFRQVKCSQRNVILRLWSSIDSLIASHVDSCTYNINRITCSVCVSSPTCWWQYGHLALVPLLLSAGVMCGMPAAGCCYMCVSRETSRQCNTCTWLMMCCCPREFPLASSGVLLLVRFLPVLMAGNPAMGKPWSPDDHQKNPQRKKTK